MREIPLPEGPFDVVYADPPWAYRKSVLVDRGSARAVEAKYPTMQPAQIESLDVGSICAKDSVLFLWATGPKMPEALSVMKAWGFTYRTVAFVWVKLTRRGDKLHFGMGFYTRANAELCLVGTRGRGVRRVDAAVRQVVQDVYDGPEEDTVSSPIERHSKKPDEVRSRIERLYGGRRVELFARGAYDGWTCWGLDAPQSGEPRTDGVSDG